MERTDAAIDRERDLQVRLLLVSSLRNYLIKDYSTPT
jgi:hypothetical protein